MHDEREGVNAYYLPSEVAELLMLPLDDVWARIGSGELPTIALPAIGPVVPEAWLPAYHQPTEHEV